ncbi:MAG: hypothetical protein Q8J68_00535 [Methanolobus sp.]|nr:hypothetical protein [Methanolobus sp.]MDP2215769.1 hypothetical protein [Methanolobus sp.]
MTINSMPLARTRIVAECICDQCGHIFEVDWQCKNRPIYCPECDKEVRP